MTTFVALPAETRCWFQRPQTEDKTYLYKGAVLAVGIAPTTARVRGALARAAAGLPLVSAPRLGRDQGADRVCICSPTRDASQGRRAGAHRLARDQTYRGSGADLVLLHQ